MTTENPETPADEKGDTPLDVASLFDVDALRSAYTPVRMRFRGVEYQVGASALGVLQALTVDTQGGLDKLEGESPMAYAVRLLKVAPRMMAFLCPDLPTSPAWTFDEEMAMVRVVTEVLGRVGRLRFSAPQG